MKLVIAHTKNKRKEVTKKRVMLITYLVVAARYQRENPKGTIK